MWSKLVDDCIESCKSTSGPVLFHLKQWFENMFSFFINAQKRIHTQHYLRANRMLPPTSVTIQSGIARLTIANISAARNSVALIVVNLSMALFGFDAIRSNPEFAQQLYLFWLFFIYLFSCRAIKTCDSGFSWQMVTFVLIGVKLVGRNSTASILVFVWNEQCGKMCWYGQKIFCFWEKTKKNRFSCISC